MARQNPSYFFLPYLRAHEPFVVLGVEFTPVQELGTAAVKAWDEYKTDIGHAKLQRWRTDDQTKVIACDGTKWKHEYVWYAAQLLAYVSLSDRLNIAGSVNTPGTFRVVTESTMDVPMYDYSSKGWITAELLGQVRPLERYLKRLPQKQRRRYLRAIRWYNKSYADGQEDIVADAILDIATALEAFLELKENKKKQEMEKKLLPVLSRIMRPFQIRALIYQLYQARNDISHEGLVEGKWYFCPGREWPSNIPSPRRTNKSINLRKKWSRKVRLFEKKVKNLETTNRHMAWEIRRRRNILNVGRNIFDVLLCFEIYSSIHKWDMRLWCLQEDIVNLLKG